ncbi:hypothetical protein [Streptomyces sp. SID3343]|uniref:response regulator transcription factor n=1 Tax=Streptomyces sp. SID3343 TaxID=2690260 RepID=UPI0019251FF1|nr:hypothetical protein [Streptomyces sp. SID3343]
MSVRVLVADDRTLVRVGLCGIVAAAPGFVVVGEAGTDAAAVELARRELPDVVGRKDHRILLIWSLVGHHKTRVRIHEPTHEGSHANRRGSRLPTAVPESPTTAVAALAPGPGARTTPDKRSICG